MPQGVDNQFKSGINAPLSRSLPSARSETSNGARDLFQKVLDSSRQKVREPEAQPKPKQSENNSKASARSKRAESTSRRRRPDTAEDASTDQPEQSDASAVETTDDASPPAETDTTADAQPAKNDKESKDAEESTDPVAQAVNPAQQNATQVQSVVPEPGTVATDDDSDHPTDETANPLVALKTVEAKPNPANQQVAADAAKDPSANAVADSEEKAIQAGFQIPADKSASESADSGKIPVGKSKKVSAIGQTTPPTADEVLKAKSAVSQTKPQSAIQSLSTADILAQLADPDFSTDASDDGESPVKPLTDALSSDPNSTAPVEPSATKTSTPDAQRIAPQPPAPREVEFADTNHDRIVTSLKSQLMPNGGTMHMRLDPPELGVLQITVKMQDGVMTASFETTNNDATKLLSHSLGQLKAALESQGVSVEKLHVQESPGNQQSGADDQQNQQSQQGDHSARQEQQRRELLKRMWRRLGIGSDPLDMVA